MTSIVVLVTVSSCTGRAAQIRKHSKYSPSHCFQPKTIKMSDVHVCGPDLREPEQAIGSHTSQKNHMVILKRLSATVQSGNAGGTMEISNCG